MSQDRFGPMDRIPPQNLEAEQAVLGSMMIERAAVERAAEILKPEDFYRDAHRFIFEAILALAERDEPVDLITLPDELKSRSLFESVGGMMYLMNLMDAPSTAANVEYYAKLVEEKSILRRIIDAGTQIQGLAHSEFDAIDDVVDRAERIVFEVGQRRMGQFFYALRPLLDEELDRIEKRYENKGMTTGRQTPFDDLNYMTAGLQPSDLIILAARPSMGKCLTAHTRLDHPLTGERLTIEEYVQQRIPLAFGVSECGRIEHKDVGDWIDSGIQPCFRVTTLTGRVVEVTGHHPFLTVGGWTPLHDLKVGSALAVPRAVPAFGTDDSLPGALIRLLAYFIAEGGLTGSSPAFTNTDPEIIADFTSILQTHYPTCRLRKESITYTVTQGRTGGLPNPVTLWLREWGLWGKYAAEKAFPAGIWHWTRPLLAEFLRALFSCDGTIYSMQGYPRIEFAVASQLLAEDVHHALTRFGIVAKLWQKGERCWRVEITEPEAVATYQSEIGWLGEKANRFPLKKSLKTLASPDIYWDRITCIEPIGEHQVYDLTVPAGANFVAEDIFVHNTSLAMQLAQHIALEERMAVAIFSLEMSKEQLVNRMICSEARVDAQRLRTGFLQGDDWQRVGEGISRLAEAPIFIDDTPDVSAMEMRAKCRRLQAEHGLGLIMIDYLQLMRSHKRTENRNQEISEIARACKGLARELKVPVIALSQLSRAVESRPDKRPMLSDLRECVIGDTLLIDATSGTQVAIRDIRTGASILGMGSDQKLRSYQVEDVWSTGIKPVYTLTTRTGRTITASANHPFLTATGWKRLDELTEGDVIATAMQLPSHGREIPERASLCRLLGYLTGDGTFQTHRSVCFCGSDQLHVEDAIGIVQHYFPEVHWREKKRYGTYAEGDFTCTYANGYGKPGGNPLREWLRCVGVYGCKDNAKFIPDYVFEAGEIGAREFLTGYFSSDGCIKYIRSGWVVHFDTVSLRLAQGVQSLLLRLGIVAGIGQGSYNTKSTQPIYRVYVYSFASNLRRFAEQIKPLGRKGELITRMTGELPETMTNGSIFSLPVEISQRMFEKTSHLRQQGRKLEGKRLYWKHQGKRPHRSSCAAVAAQLQDEELRVWAASDLLWEPIASIESAGEQETFDIKVECANFLANGIVAHNSGSIEAEADIVMFIYRDAYYKMKESVDADEEIQQQQQRHDRGEEAIEEAEIIIAKQRNGPTGKVVVGFMKQYARFANLDRTRPPDDGD